MPSKLVIAPTEATAEMAIAGGEAQQQSIGSWGEPRLVYEAALAARPPVSADDLEQYVGVCTDAALAKLRDDPNAQWTDAVRAVLRHLAEVMK